LVLCITLCITLTVVAIRSHHWIPRVLAVFTAVIALSLLFFQEIQIDAQRSTVVEVSRIFGVIPFSRRERTMREFSGISCRCPSRDIDAISDTWTVTLHPRYGRALKVRHFSVPTGSEDCPEARAFARELSRETGLELIDYVA